MRPMFRAMLEVKRHVVVSVVMPSKQNHRDASNGRCNNGIALQKCGGVVPIGGETKSREEARQMAGEDIEMKMRTMVTDVKKASYESSFLGEGRFYDETEIEKEYFHRPW